LLRHWEELASDLDTCLVSHGYDQIIGIGHSVGGVITLMASVMNPNLFRAIVLLDPVIFCGFRAWTWGWMQRFGLAERFHLVQGATTRRNEWKTIGEVRESWASKPVFNDWDPDCLKDYLACGLVDAPDGGVTLRYPREWEARVFETTPSSTWPWIKRLNVPTLVVRGAESDTFLPNATWKFARSVPGAEFAEIPGSGHLFPMERPGRAAKVVLEFLDSL